MAEPLPPLPPGAVLDQGGIPPLPPGAVLNQPAPTLVPPQPAVDRPAYEAEMRRRLAEDPATLWSLPNYTDWAAQTAGVSNAGAPTLTRYMASFGGGQPDPEIYRAALSHYFGKPVETRLGPQTQAVEYLDPRSGQWTLARPNDDVLGNLAGLVGDISVGGYGAAGALAGGVAGTPGGPVGMGAGGLIGEMAGTYIGEYNRLQAGQRMGVVPATMTPEDMALEAANAAIWAGAGSSVASAAFRLAKRIMGRGAPNIDPDEFARRLELRREQMAPLGPDVQPTPGQVMRGTPVGDELAAAEARAAGGVGAVRDMMRGQAEAGLGALSRAMPATVTPSVTGEGVGRAVVGAANRSIAEDMAGDAAVAEYMNARAVESLLGVPGGARPTGVGAVLRQAAESSEARAQIAADQVYQGLRAEAAPIQVDPAPYVRVAGDLQAVLDDSTFTSLSEVDQQLIREMASLQDAGTITFSQTQNDLQAIRRARRAFRSNLTHTGDVRILDQIEAAIIEARTEALEAAGRPDLAERFVAADLAYRQQRDLYDRTFIGKVRLTREGQYVLENEDVFDAYFKRDNISTANELHTLLSQPENAAAMGQWREAIFTEWRRRVVDPATGLPDPMKATQFNQTYGETIAPFLSPAERARLNNTAAFAQDAATQAQRLTDLQAELMRTTEGQISTIAPSEVFSKTWAGDVETLRRTVRLMENYSPERLIEYQQLVGDDLLKAVTQTGNGVTFVNPTALNAYIGANENRLRAVFGPEHVNGLRAIQQAIEAMDTQAMAVTPPSPTAGFIPQAWRVIFGPLSRHNRTMTAAVRLQARDARTILVRAIQDPDVMQQLLRLRHISPTSRAAARILGGLGGYSLVASDSVGQAPGAETLGELTSDLAYELLGAEP